MQIIIDTNVFLKLYGYDKSKKDSDEKINLSLLYTELTKPDNEILLTALCLSELATKPFAKNCFNKWLEFCYKLGIKGVGLNKGKITVGTVDEESLSMPDLSEGLEIYRKQKLKYESIELKEYIKYCVFVIKYLIVDIINVRFYEQDMETVNLYETVDGLFKENNDHISKVINIAIDSILEKYYSNSIDKKELTKLVNTIYEKIFVEVYFHLISVGDNVYGDICKREIAELQKYPNKYEYISKTINFIEKVTDCGEYLAVINQKYYEELKSLHYSDFFAEYVIWILRKQLLKKKFDKNDCIDSSLFHFKTADNYILSFDKTVQDFLKEHDEQNHSFIRQFEKA